MLDSGPSEERESTRRGLAAKRRRNPVYEECPCGARRFVDARRASTRVLSLNVEQIRVKDTKIQIQPARFKQAI